MGLDGEDPTRKALQTGSHVKSTHYTGLLLPRAPRVTIFVVPTANQRDSPGSFAATASSTKLCEEEKKKAPCILCCQPRPRPSRRPGPLAPWQPEEPATRVPRCPAAPTRVPASRRLPAPPRAETAGQGEGRPRPAGPRGGRTPPPGPAAFPPSPFEQLPPAFLLSPLQPLPGGGLQPLLQSPARPLG